MFHLIHIWTFKCHLLDLFFLNLKKKEPLNQIKSLLLSHNHSTWALVSEILESVLQTVQKQFTRQYILTEDNVQNTQTFTQYTQCTI